MTMTRVPIEVPLSAAAGSEYGEAFELMSFGAQPNAGYIQLRGTFTATYQVQVSMVHPKEDHWEQVGTDITAAQASPLAVPAGPRYIRIKCTAYTSHDANDVPYAYFHGETTSD